MDKERMHRRPVKPAGASPPEPDYLVEEIRRSLALDPRLHELGIQVQVASGKVVLSGDVPTPARREAVGEVARELAPGYEVHNDVAVLDLVEVDDVEDIS
jgi:osmotically-inducible protein OsmY